MNVCPNHSSIAVTMIKSGSSPHTATTTPRSRRELLDVIAEVYAVLAQDVAVVPEFS